MAKYFVPDTTLGMDAECAVCCCLWTDPVEISGCQHIFCRGCVEGLETCPVCCGPANEFRTPGKFILRLLQRTRGSCNACSWKGTYNEFKEKHVKCLEAGETQSIEEDDAPSSLEAETMQGYYLERNTADDTRARSSTAPIAQSSPAERKVGTDLPGSPHGRPSSSNADVSATVCDCRLTSEQRAEWRQSLTMTAADFGMSTKEYRELIERFAHFAVCVAGKHQEPTLRWRDACRFLRFLNYPSHPDDVKNLFEMANRNPVTESVSFHVVCLWLMLNRRNPAQWYNMTVASYERILQVAQLLDVDETGLLTVDQCRILAEQYFERDLDEREWSSIEQLLRTKDAEIRQSFLGHGGRRHSGRHDSAIASVVKLPFHDVLRGFARHTDVLKKNQQMLEARRAQEDFIRRIKRVVEYYDPPAMPRLDATLVKFIGEEESLLMTLVAMYGPEPR